MLPLQKFMNVVLPQTKQNTMFDSQASHEPFPEPVSHIVGFDDTVSFFFSFHDLYIILKTFSFRLKFFLLFKGQKRFRCVLVMVGLTLFFANPKTTCGKMQDWQSLLRLLISVWIEMLSPGSDIWEFELM